MADHARVIEARRTGTYRVSEAERETLTTALKEADQGEFATEGTVRRSLSLQDILSR
ncbi:hypothetical protein [Chelativorans salis]|uniref:Anti-sigma-28 factor FlgM C-terminal domain-containing protein n=1 Tax=Chelativorans salis TaxID=2978478 RepID=A0ABT2LNY9_9HYPH|nr:hypothetical protein [Chelativorans sp. EGI FJ00035]MCO0638084.1 hypothetical protein [Lutimaribacter sp. EGI FJ00014]MCT7374899.1 hypothetical protein [Chelativorans sp. EGI FJ00035]